MKNPTVAGKGLQFTQPQPQKLLTRIFDEPELVTMVQALPPQALGKLIAHVGLEDSGELVALATTEQLQKIFDADLWRSPQPGQDASFDADRFAVWLEVMLEAGEDFVAEKLTELPEELVVMALQQQVLVISMDELALGWLEDYRDFDMTEKALDSCLYHEIDEYRVMSRHHDGWDAVVTVLTALDQNHHEFLQRLLERCCAAASEYIDDNGGLYNILTSEEMLQVDAAAEREERRAREGFIAPSDAASFLALARQSPLPEIVAAPRDPITRGYFRNLAPASTASTNEGAAKAAKLLDVLKQAQVIEEVPPINLLEHGSSARSAASGRLFQRAMIRLREHDASIFVQRLEEVAYLANVLLAGHGIGGRSLRPFEAAEAAIDACNRGLEYLINETAAGDRDADEPHRAVGLLQAHGADKLFRIGWHLQWARSR